MNGRAAAGVAGTVLGGVALSGVFLLVLNQAPTQAPLIKATPAGTVSTASGPMPSATLNLAAYGDSSNITWRSGHEGQGAHPDWVSFGPSTKLQVPAHSVIIVTIKQYDTGGPLPNPALALVSGTTDGTMTVDGVQVTKIDPSAVGHTFTIHSFPTATQDDLFVSVPLPAVPDNSPNVAGTDLPQPKVVTFEFVTKGPGVYAWNCEYPCGWYQSDRDGNGGMGGPMSTFGYMSGTLTVV